MRDIQRGLKEQELKFKEYWYIKSTSKVEYFEIFPPLMLPQTRENYLNYL